MTNDLDTSQRELCDFMSDLSERYYSAGWMTNLEYVLWDAILNGERKYGHGFISNANISKLVELSNQCGCWIYFDGKTEETAIDLIKWKDVFEKEIIADPEKIKRW